MKLDNKEYSHKVEGGPGNGELKVKASLFDARLNTRLDLRKAKVTNIINVKRRKLYDCIISGDMCDSGLIIDEANLNEEYLNHIFGRMKIDEFCLNTICSSSFQDLTNCAFIDLSDKEFEEWSYQLVKLTNFTSYNCSQIKRIVEKLLPFSAFYLVYLLNSSNYARSQLILDFMIKITQNEEVSEESRAICQYFVQPQFVHTAIFILQNLVKQAKNDPSSTKPIEVSSEILWVVSNCLAENNSFISEFLASFNINNVHSILSDLLTLSQADSNLAKELLINECRLLGLCYKSLHSSSTQFELNSCSISFLVLSNISKFFESYPDNDSKYLYEYQKCLFKNLKITCNTFAAADDLHNYIACFPDSFKLKTTNFHLCVIKSVFIQSQMALKVRNPFTESNSFFFSSHQYFCQYTFAVLKLNYESLSCRNSLDLQVFEIKEDKGQEDNLKKLIYRCLKYIKHLIENLDKSDLLKYVSMEHLSFIISLHINTQSVIIDTLIIDLVTAYIQRGAFSAIYFETKNLRFLFENTVKLNLNPSFQTFNLKYTISWLELCKLGLVLEKELSRMYCGIVNLILNEGFVNLVSELLIFENESISIVSRQISDYLPDFDEFYY